MEREGLNSVPKQIYYCILCFWSIMTYLLSTQDVIHKTTWVHGERKESFFKTVYE